MRKKLVAGNWKSFLDVNAAIDLLNNLNTGLADKNNLPDIAVFPPFVYITNALTNSKGVYAVGAQNCSAYTEGAYTGEVTAKMLQSVGAGMVLTGHSERRQLFGETNEVVKQKTDLVLNAGLTPVFCCGETLDLRNEEKHKDWVFRQLEESLFHLSELHFGKVIIAYEPVWAIGTGVNATPEQAQEMQAFIRSTIAVKYGSETANNTRILYGGSVKPDNANALFRCLDVDGGLVGGASLKAADFLAIIQAAV